MTKEYSWVAMDETAKKDSDIKHLAPSVVHATKSMFIIRVQYYVQIMLCFGMLQRAISVKLPFLLKRSTELTEAKTSAEEAQMNSKEKKEKTKAGKDKEKEENKENGGDKEGELKKPGAETETRACNNTEGNGIGEIGKVKK